MQQLRALLAHGGTALLAVVFALGACPFCASRIPYDSTHCAYCGSGLAPGEP